MTTIHLYGFAGSTYVRSAMIACEQLGLDWDLKPLEFGQASHLALHPFGKMPALQHGSVDLYETAAILSYLNDLAEGAPLIPTEPLARARMWQLISICIDYAYPALVKATFADDTSQIDTEPADRCLAAIETLVKSGACLTGDRLSLADLVFEPMLTHYLKTIPGGEKHLEGRPGVTRWYRDVQKQPAVIAAYRESQSE